MASNRSALLLLLNVLFFALATSASATCPIDTQNLSVCADVLGLVNVVAGSPPTVPCCSLIQGLVDLDAAVGLCTALKGDVLGTNLNVPLSFSVLVNACGRTAPTGFLCD